MRVLQSSFFRAIIAIVIGALLVQYREQTVQWITIAIGVMFFLSGIISCATYFSARRSAASTVPLFDDDGQRIEPLQPNFPIVGLGSLILGVILALMPATFIDWLMYIMAAILILGAVNQFVNLASARKFAHVGAFYWVMPSLILLVGLLAILYPRAIASAPLFVLLVHDGLRRGGKPQLHQDTPLPPRLCQGRGSPQGTAATAAISRQPGRGRNDRQGRIAWQGMPNNR